MRDRSHQYKKRENTAQNTAPCEGDATLRRDERGCHDTILLFFAQSQDRQNEFTLFVRPRSRRCVGTINKRGIPIRRELEDVASVAPCRYTALVIASHLYLQVRAIGTRGVISKAGCQRAC